MDISRNGASYLLKSLIVICLTIVICFLVSSIDGRYQSYNSGGFDGLSSGYMVDTWTGKAWNMTGNSYVPVERSKKGKIDN